jgi:serine/threonine protein kinase
MSPEQTGRMNRDLDYRSDLYSLGVTFYEMLTGRLPFESADLLEVVHGHVAVTPVAPHVRNPAVPATLSRRVLKLLAKAAEDRYQSAEGVVADLSRCRGAWEAEGEIPDLVLGQEDVRDRFVLPSGSMAGSTRWRGCSRRSIGWRREAASWCWSRATRASARHP